MGGHGAKTLSRISEERTFSAYSMRSTVDLE